MLSNNRKYKDASGIPGRSFPIFWFSEKGSEMFHNACREYIKRHYSLIPKECTKFNKKLLLLLNKINLTNMKKLEEIYKEQGLKDDELKLRLEQAKHNLDAEIERTKEHISENKLTITRCLKEEDSFETDDILEHVDEKEINERKLEILIKLKEQLF